MCSSALCCAAERMAGAGGHIAGPMRPACLGGWPIGQCWETDLISSKTGRSSVHAVHKKVNSIMADMFSKEPLAWPGCERGLKRTATFQVHLNAGPYNAQPSSPANTILCPPVLPPSNLLI